ncbi:MAG: hypothetical protein WCZ87_03105 [Thiohalobacteraceae bacterium]
MEQVNIRTIFYSGVVGLSVGLPVPVQSQVLTFRPAAPISIEVAELTGDYDSAGPFSGTPNPVYLDLNLDGSTDLTFYNERYRHYQESQGEDGADYWFTASETISDVLRVAPTGRLHGERAFAPGELIGPDTAGWVDQALSRHTSVFEDHCVYYDYQAEVSYSECSLDYSGTLSGTLFSGDSPTTDAYVGFSFLVDGREHLGWADVDADYSGTAFIHGWAWETASGEAIAAGVVQTPLPPAAWLLGSGLLALWGRSVWAGRFTAGR